jgi:alpha-beta hydrolase superfamily lysophospholipase
VISNLQNLVFTIAVTLTCRAFALRDKLLGRLRHRKMIIGVQISRHEILRETHTLDSVFVSPVQSPTAALLICHGIGEVVENWQAAQQLLALHGVASLVFDYSGFGKSGRGVDWRACEDDAVSAFSLLQTLVPGVPMTLLGFSMGSGIAGAILNRVSPAQLILCSAFTSFRDAACVLGLPRPFARVLPPIWSANETLSNCSLPVLVVHCARDRAFPVRMARELASLCDPKAELVIVPEQAHNEAFYDPKLSYWHYVLDHIASDGSHSPGTST